MTVIDHYRLLHRIASSQIYTYSELIEMLPYERDAFHNLIEEDAYREQQRQQNQNRIV